MGKAFNLLVDEQGIGRLYFDLKGQPVNLFNEAVFDELEVILQKLEAEPVAALLILSAKENVFIAGADIHAFQEINSFDKGRQAARRGQLLFQRLSLLPFPTIAVIHGACMGGGTEMSLACTYRLATNHPKTRIGLPEVRLGILPGWGGTQRLPQITGLSAALNLILSGKAISARKALSIGLVERLLGSEKREEQALQFAREVIRGAVAFKNKKKSFRLEQFRPVRTMILHMARKRVLKETRGLYPAPLKAIEVIEKTWNMPIEQGLEVEARALADLIVTPQSKNLVSLFVWSEELKKEARTMLSGVLPRPVLKVSLLNVDSTFSDLCIQLLRKGKTVTLIDFEEQRLEAIRQNLHSKLKRLRQKKRITESEFQRLWQNISFERALHALKDSDLLLTGWCDESLWEQIEQNLPDSAIVLQVGPLCMDNKPSVAVNFCTWQENSMVAEVRIPGPEREAEVKSILNELLQINRIPVMVHSSAPGLASRLFLAFMAEAMCLLREGFSEKQIDWALTQFGWRQGPFAMLQKMGKENLRGWFCGMKRVGSEKVAEESQDVGDIEEWANASEVRNSTSRSRLTESTAQKIQQRIHLLLLNRAASFLEQGLARRARDVDFLLVGGFGFPPFRGGIFKFADTLGISAVLNQLQQLKEEHGERFDAAELLKQMARESQLFYP